jgi:hypothetical protein
MSTKKSTRKPKNSIEDLKPINNPQGGAHASGGGGGAGKVQMQDFHFVSR